jgi:hypothetical protein
MKTILNNSLTTTEAITIFTKLLTILLRNVIKTENATVNRQIANIAIVKKYDGDVSAKNSTLPFIRNTTISINEMK